MALSLLHKYTTLKKSIMNLGNVNATPFKTWWVQLPMVKAIELRNNIKAALGWSDQQWFSRLNGKTPFTPAEKQVITTLSDYQFPL